jgi:hypothetical protein
MKVKKEGEWTLLEYDEKRFAEIAEEAPVPRGKTKMHEVYHKDVSEWRYYAVPFAPLSHNNAYGTARNGKRFIRAEYDEYKTNIKHVIRMIDRQQDQIKLYGDSYELVFAGVFTRDAMFFKKGSLKKIDPDGFIKLAQDATFEYLEVDDSTVLKVTSYKVEMTPLPFEEKRYSESPVWDLKGGVLVIGIRTVPLHRVSEITREDDPQLREMISKAVRLENYIEPRVNMNRGKKEQARRMDRHSKKVARAQHTKIDKTKGKRKR